MRFYEASIFTSASPEAIWKQYTEVHSWHKWDGELSKCELLGAFGNGAKIKLSPKEGPGVTAKITDCVLNRAFTSTSGIPCLIKISFHHKIEPIRDGAKITHQIILEGCLARIFHTCIGPSIAKGLSKSLEELGKLANERSSKER